MKAIVNNSPVSIIADEFYQLMDGVSLFFGVINTEKDTFFPFYGIGGHYEGGFVFETEETMTIVDPKEELWPDHRDIDEIHAEFLSRKADYPAAVTNVKLYERIHKMAMIRKNRRVSWRGTNEHGTVMKVDSSEIQVLWDADKAVSQPTIDYDLMDETVQPVS